MGIADFFTEMPSLPAPGKSLGCVSPACRLTIAHELTVGNVAGRAVGPKAPGRFRRSGARFSVAPANRRRWFSGPLGKQRSLLQRFRHGWIDRVAGRAG